MNKIKIPFVVFEITPHCNLNCKYCYNIWKMPESQRPVEGTFGQAKKTLSYLFKKVDLDCVTMSGGEPFMFKRFLELVLFCRMKKKQVNIISNGSLGTMDQYKSLVEMGINFFEFPVHSFDEAVHDDIAEQQGAWKKSVASIQNVLSLGGNVVVVIVLTKLNYRDVKKTLHFIKSLGVNRVMLNRFNIGGQGIQEYHKIGLTHEELNETFTLANEGTIETGITSTSNVCTPFCIVNPEDYSHIGFSACYPNSNNRSWALDTSGNLRYCNHSPKVIANIFKEDFKNILTSDYLKEWCTTVPDICKDCDIYDKCWAGCRAASEQLGLPLSYADPILYDMDELKLLEKN